MMVKKVNDDLWGFVGRFSLVHVVIYFLFATAFLLFQQALPTSERVALDFFQPYHAFNLSNLLVQFFRGIILSLILYPFSDLLLRKNFNWLILFSAVWGLGLLGSVNTLPGSIEGFIYTRTSITEHLIVLMTKAFQAVIFSWLFIKWETKKKNIYKTTEMVLYKKPIGYFGKFILLHVITYTLMGILFMNLQDYEGTFSSMEQFALFRPLDDPLVKASLFIQIVRGGLLALFIYPFFSNIANKNKGWLLLFGLLYGFTALSTMLPDLIKSIASGSSLGELITGPVEITVQMLLFSWLFFRWEKKMNKNNIELKKDFS